MKNGILILNVLSGSLGAKQGIAPGDRLIAIDGHRIRDLIDYQYWSGAWQLLLEIEKPDGSLWECEVEGADEEPLGLIFEPPRPATCGNSCVFCFVHQLPKGLRKQLYVKDEDYRLSFLYGNYVTMSNISSANLNRIKRQRLSPLYISVHATDVDLRENLLGRKGIIPILDLMKELAAANIKMHTQIVLCPGLNDANALEKTVTDLVSLFPYVASLAIVPLGLTSHRKGLQALKPVTSDYAASFVCAWQDQIQLINRNLGQPFIFLADEFYLKAGLPFPPFEFYGDLPQLENGVGMIALFREEASAVIKKAGYIGEGKMTLVTGISAFQVVSEFLEDLSEKTGVELNLIPVENQLFGSSVTVTGLLSGKDIISALEGRQIGDRLIIPDVMLKEGEGLFLDDLTVKDLEKNLKVRVRVVGTSPDSLYVLMKKEFKKRSKI